MPAKRKAVNVPSAPLDDPTAHLVPDEAERPSRRARLEDPTGGDSPLTALSDDSPPSPIVPSGSGVTTRRASRTGTAGSTPAPPSLAGGRRGAAQPGLTSTPGGRRRSGGGGGGGSHARRTSLQPTSHARSTGHGEGHHRGTSDDYGYRAPRPLENRAVTPLAPNELRFPHPPSSRPPSAAAPAPAWQDDRVGGGRNRSESQPRPQAQQQYDVQDPADDLPVHPHESGYSDPRRGQTAVSNGTSGASPFPRAEDSAAGDEYDDPEYVQPHRPPSRGGSGRGRGNRRVARAATAGEGGRKTARRNKPSAPRTSRACLQCRHHKMRCIGAEDPPCHRCKGQGIDCVFERRSDYILNPEDVQWQRRTEDKILNVCASLDAIHRCLQLNGFAHVPTDDMLPHLLDTGGRVIDELVVPPAPPGRPGGPYQGQGGAGPSGVTGQEDWYDQTVEMEHSQDYGYAYHHQPQQRHPGTGHASVLSGPPRRHQPQSDLRSTSQTGYAAQSAPNLDPSAQEAYRPVPTGVVVPDDPTHQRHYDVQPSTETVSDPLLSLSTASAAVAALQPASSSMPNFSTHAPTRNGGPGTGRGDTVVVAVAQEAGGMGANGTFQDPRRQGLARAREREVVAQQESEAWQQNGTPPPAGQRHASQGASGPPPPRPLEVDQPRGGRVDVGRGSDDAAYISLGRVVHCLTVDHGCNEYWDVQQDRVWTKVFEKRGLQFDHNPEVMIKYKADLVNWIEDEQADRLLQDAPAVMEEWQQLFPTIFTGAWARANDGKPDLDLCSQPLLDALLCLVSVRHPDQHVKELFPRLYWSLTKQARALKETWELGKLPRESLRESFDILVAFMIGTVFLSCPSDPDYFIKPSRIYSMLTRVDVLTRSYDDVKQGIFTYPHGGRHDPTLVQWWRMYLWLASTMIICSSRYALPVEFFEAPHWKNRKELLDVPREHREPSDVLLLALLDLLRGWQFLKADWEAKDFDVPAESDFWNRNRRCVNFVKNWETTYRARTDAFKSRYTSGSAAGLVNAVTMGVMAFKGIVDVEVSLRVDLVARRHVPNDLCQHFATAVTDALAQLEAFGDLKDVLWLRNAPSMLQRSCLLPAIIALKAVRAQDCRVVDFGIDSIAITDRIERIVATFAQAGISEQFHPVSSARYLRDILDETIAGRENKGHVQPRGQQDHAVQAPPDVRYAPPEPEHLPTRHRSTSVVAPPSSFRTPSMSTFEATEPAGPSPDPFPVLLAAASAGPGDRHSMASLPSTMPSRSYHRPAPMHQVPSPTPGSSAALAQPDSSPLVHVGPSASISHSHAPSNVSPEEHGSILAQPPSVSPEVMREQATPSQPMARRQSAASIAEQVFNDEAIFSLPMQRSRSMSMEDLEEILSNPEYDGPLPEA